MFLLQDTKELTNLRNDGESLSGHAFTDSKFRKDIFKFFMIDNSIPLKKTFQKLDGKLTNFSKLPTRSKRLNLKTRYLCSHLGNLEFSCSSKLDLSAANCSNIVGSAISLPIPSCSSSVFLSSGESLSSASTSS